jgi:predicted DNA-binding transcriptional regulator YafY
MASKPKSLSGTSSRTVTARRAARLYRLLQLLARGPQSREALTRQLHCDVRSFYRDLVLLRGAGIDLPLVRGRYLLEEAEDALARLPFPDLGLTLGEARQLAQGRTEAHRKVKSQIDQIIAGPKSRGQRNAK